MLCEARRIEVFLSFWYSSKKLLTKSPVSGSRDAVGSSRRRTDGSLIIDLARLTLFFCPEESSPVILLINSLSLNFSLRLSIFIPSFYTS